jgi:hypothetical protein
MIACASTESEMHSTHPLTAACAQNRLHAHAGKQEDGGGEHPLTAGYALN